MKYTMGRLASMAALRGYPAFPFGVERSTPINSTPYVVGVECLRSNDRLVGRPDLVTALIDALADLSNSGMSAQAVLIGGSALDENCVAKDLDCVVFYIGAPSNGTALDLWLQRTRDIGLDVRLIPLDGDPVLTLKAALFFGTLYSQRYGEHERTHGVLLVDCRN